MYVPYQTAGPALPPELQQLLPPEQGSSPPGTQFLQVQPVPAPTNAQAVSGRGPVDDVVLRLSTPVKGNNRPVDGVLRELGRLVAAWPNLFNRYFGRTWNVSGALRQLGIPSGDPTASVFAAAILAQRGSAVQQERQWFQQGLLEYQPQHDGFAEQALTVLDPAFVRWATVEPTGFVSIAGFKRFLRDIDPHTYQQMLPAAVVSPVNEQQLVEEEKLLVQARMVKAPFQIWDQLSQGTRDTLTKIGVRIPEPWSVYHPTPDASLSARALRLLTFVNYARDAAAAQFAETSPSGQPVVPVTVWSMSTELLSFRPPQDIMQTFRDPAGPDGFITPAAFLSLIWLTKNIEARGASSERQQLVNLIGERAYQWLAQAPQPAQVAQAIAFPKEAVAALAFSRIVRERRDYFKNLHVGDQQVFCQQGWEAGQRLSSQQFQRVAFQDIQQRQLITRSQPFPTPPPPQSPPPVPPPTTPPTTPPPTTPPTAPPALPPARPPRRPGEPITRRPQPCPAGTQRVPGGQCLPATGNQDRVVRPKNATPDKGEPVKIRRRREREPDTPRNNANVRPGNTEPKRRDEPAEKREQPRNAPGGNVRIRPRNDVVRKPDCPEGSVPTLMANGRYQCKPIQPRDPRLVTPDRDELLPTNAPEQQVTIRPRNAPQNATPSKGKLLTPINWNRPELPKNPFPGMIKRPETPSAPTPQPGQNPQPGVSWASWTQQNVQPSQDRLPVQQNNPLSSAQVPTFSPLKLGNQGPRNVPMQDTPPSDPTAGGFLQ